MSAADIDTGAKLVGSNCAGCQAGSWIQHISVGLFLARVLRGSHITMQQMRVDNGIWMPERVEVRAAAKIFFVKSLVIDQVLTYSEYRLPQAGVPVQ